MYIKFKKCQPLFWHLIGNRAFEIYINFFEKQLERIMPADLHIY